MEKELISFISENKLNPFEPAGKLRRKDKSIFMTTDSRAVFNKTLDKLNSQFIFSDSENLWNCFPFTDSMEDIKKKQDFFSKITLKDNKFLKELEKPKNWWKPKYGILAVTEDEKTFQELQKLNIPCQFINSQYDLEGLESYDIVQVIDCDNFSEALERLPQSVFLDSINEVYLERYLEILSGWKNNLEVLDKSESNGEIQKLPSNFSLSKSDEVSHPDLEIKKIVGELVPLLKLLDSKQVDKILRENIESALEKINSEISLEIEKMSISGTTLLAMLSKGKLPDDLLKIVENAVKKTNLPEEIFSTSIPICLNDDEVEKLIKKQDSSEFTEIAEKVKRHAVELRKIPKLIQQLSDLLIYFDFISGISQVIAGNLCFPEMSHELYFSEAENIFLDSPQAISFSLDDKNKCSILTGANSGGKTTLIEHIIQLVTFFQLGLPVRGNARMPLFSEVYYFAKNKGSASKGAFETLLTQMASIKPKSENKTLILADEIESVTEPGVAGKIISATAEFFVNKGCFLVIATHLGQEIQKCPPLRSRIDGIEAKGLNENFELIVDHNPVLGRIASSTPELIIEKMASLNSDEYFAFLRDKIKGG